MSEKLKPCPFCGGEASAKVLEYDDDCKVWGVFCESDLAGEYSHGHFVYNYATEAEAITAWNTRAERMCQNVGYYIDGTHFKCSECGYNGWTKWAKDGEDRIPKYCPNCGARVVGKEGE